MTLQTETSTKAVRAGVGTDTAFGAVMPPLYLSSNFTFEGLGKQRTYDYTRSGNPTRDLLSEALCELEGGAGGVITATGMAAITLALQLIPPGGYLLAPHDCYGGSHRLFSALAAKGQFRVNFIDQTDDGALAAALEDRPDLVWIETPSNPLLRITDVAKVASLSKQCGALVAVDNTFLSPICQQPLALGADLAVHSTTKYINGHSDVVGGAVIARTESLAEKLTWWANCLGITAAPYDCFLTLRGLRTLHVRMRTHLENALEVVEVLNQHDAVAQVYHPSLPGHPGHLTAAKQQQGFGAMVSFELWGGSEAVAVFLEHLSCFSLAESLGGVESLVAHPATMTHAAMTPQAREIAGIRPGLLRLSVGLESQLDLCAALSRALDRVLVDIHAPNAERGCASE